MKNVSVYSGGLLAMILLGSPLQAFDTLDEVVSRSLSRNLDVALAALKLKNSAANLAAEPAWRSSSLGLSANRAASLDSASSSGSTPGVATGTSYGASLSLPLTDWFSFGATGTVTSDGSVSSSLSATLNPFSGQTSKANIDYRSNLQSYRSTLRSAVLQFRGTVRSLVVSGTELAYKKAALDEANAQYEQKQVLLSQGAASQSDLLDALASQTQARLDYEAAEANYENVHQTIALSLGVPEAELPDFAQLLTAEGDITGVSLSSIMDKATYVAMSDAYVRAQLDAETNQIDARSAQPKPDISIQGEVTPGEKTWSATATVKLPLDLVFRESAAIAQQIVEVKQKQVEFVGQTVALEYDQKVKELNRLYESWKKTATTYSAAQLVYQQAEVLASLGQKSALDMSTAKAELLRADWQLAGAEKSLRDALDTLSTRFLFNEETYGL